MYVITEKLRFILKKPLGTLLSDSSLQSGLKTGKFCICTVGDECAYRLISAGIRPDILIFDGMTKRKAVMPEVSKLLNGFCKNPCKITNPAGTITADLDLAVSNAFAAGHGCIIVEGEEDLATLAAMKYSKESWAIVYGQPEDGAVLVLGGSAANKRAQSLLSEFEKKED